MYAIVNIAGIQTKVRPDEVLDIALHAGEPGSSLQFDQLLALAIVATTVTGLTIAVAVLASLTALTAFAD